MTVYQAIEPQMFRWTVENYYRLAEVGILGPEDKVELLDGQIVYMSPSKSKHAGFVKRLNDFLAKRLPDPLIISVQDPIHLDDYSEPEPDIAILKYKSSFYTDEHPVPSDILLVIEVADSSLERDREVKIPLYAQAGIPEYWIINLADDQLEQYTQPGPEGYREQKIIKPNGILESGVLDSVRLADFWVGGS